MNGISILPRPVVWLLIAGLGSIGLAQDKPGTSSSSQDKEGNYVRRFSAGATLSVLGIPMLSGGSSTVQNSATVGTEYDSNIQSKRLGYGLTGQVAVTDHFAVALGAYLRHLGYQLTTTITTTTTSLANGSTTASTDTQETTRTRLLDIPVMVRWYNVDRHTPGPRWFAEGGAAFREIYGSISTSISATNSTGTTTCCNTSPAKPAHRNAIGFLGGTGVQLIDPFGIRVVPEIRYIRWINPIFEAPSTHGGRNQVEAEITLSF